MPSWRCARRSSWPTRPARRPTWPAPSRRTSRTTSTTGSSSRSTSSSGSGPRRPTTSRAWSRRCDPSPTQPVLYMPNAILPYVLYYRADWFQEAKIAPPATYAEFIDAARKLARPPERYRLRAARRRLLRPPGIEPIWASAGVKIVDEQRQGRLRLARRHRRHRAVGRDVHEGQVGAGHRRERPATRSCSP